MEEMKIWKELVAIKLKDDRIITTDNSLADVAKMLNTNDFIVIGDIGFSKYEVRSFEMFNPSEIDNFIYSKKDKEVVKRLRSILEERDREHKKTNGAKHLRDIYLSRYPEN